MKNLIYTLALVIIGITSSNAQQRGKVKIESKEEKRKIESSKPEKVQGFELRSMSLNRERKERAHRLQRMRKIERKHRFQEQRRWERRRFERRQFEFGKRHQNLGTRIRVEGRRLGGGNRLEDVRVQGRRLEGGYRLEDVRVEGRRLRGDNRLEDVRVEGRRLEGGNRLEDVRVEGRRLEGGNRLEDVRVEGRRFETDNTLTAEQRAEKAAINIQKRLNLSDKQKQEIQLIELGNIKKNEEWRAQDEKERKSKMEERRAFMNSSKEKMDKILTEEQRKALDRPGRDFGTPPPPPVKN